MLLHKKYVNCIWNVPTINLRRPLKNVAIQLASRDGNPKPY